jgi:hypothetical protein
LERHFSTSLSIGTLNEAENKTGVPAILNPLISAAGLTARGSSGQHLFFLRLDLAARLFEGVFKISLGKRWFRGRIHGGP